MRRRKLREFKPVWNAERGVWEGALLEEHILREIVERLWFQAKIKVFRINQPVGGKTPQNESGLPDLMGWIPKRRDVQGLEHIAIPLYIETKRPKQPGQRGGVRSPAQIRFIEEAKLGGCVAFFADSWADVVRELATVGIELKP